MTYGCGGDLNFVKGEGKGEVKGGGGEFEVATTIWMVTW